MKVARTIVVFASIYGVFCVAADARTRPSHSAVDGQPFDRFLAGFTRCDMKKDFWRFRESVRKRYENYSDSKPANNRPGVRLIIPQAYSKNIHVKQIQSVKKDDYTEVTIPVVGTFLNLPLKSIGIIMGNESGSNVVSLEFREAPARVRSVLGPYVKRGQRYLKRNRRAGEPAATISITGNGKEVSCDFSA
jgi:hypothetical protein